MATLAGAPEWVRGALAGATRAARAGRRPVGQRAPKGHTVGGPETP